MSTGEMSGMAPGAGPADATLVIPGRRMHAGAGWDWIVRGWRLFARAPLMWIISMVLLFIVAVAMNFVPIVGSLAFQLLQAVIAGGFVVACHSLEQGGDFELEHLLAGFQKHFGSLLAVGALVLVGWMVITLVFLMFVGFSLLGAFLAGDVEHFWSAVAASSLSLLLGALVALALMVPLLAAYWFAPALVVLHGLSPIAAMKESFSGAMRNFVPFLVYGLVMAIAGILAAIPVFLGYLVWIPVAIASTYAAYRDIYTRPAARPAARVEI